MRIELQRYGRLIALAAGVAIFALAAGCEDNPDVPDLNEPTQISVDEIILTPKSPEPGDTIFLTAVLTSPGDNVGEFPKVTWSASDGTFIENGLLSVRWESPMTSALYSITCTAQNSVNSATASTQVFVGQPLVLVQEFAGEVRLTGTGDDFYYMATPEINEGTIVASYLNGSSAFVTDPVTSRFGINRVFSPDLKYSASSAFTIQSGDLLQQQNVFLTDIVAGTQVQLTTDGAAAGAKRRQQYDDPYFSPDSRYVTYGGYLPTPVQGIGTDTFDVFVEDVMTGDVQIPTETHGQRRRNAYPTFSSDGNWLVFVSDRNFVPSNSWEMYGLPITGGIVATDSSAVVRLTNTGGSITVGTPVVGLPAPPLRWTPPGTAPAFAVLSADARLYIVAVNASGGMQSTVTGLDGTARQFTWSDDGQKLAITDFSRIYVSGLDGSATGVHTAPEGDQVRDLRWSPDGNWIAYRVLRGGIGWFELLDVSAGLITEPAVITTTTSSNNVSSYSRFMSLAPVFNQNREVFLLEFIPGAQLTPRVTKLYVGGIIP